MVQSTYPLSPRVAGASDACDELFIYEWKTVRFQKRVWKEIQKEEETETETEEEEEGEGEGEEEEESVCKKEKRKSPTVVEQRTRSGVSIFDCLHSFWVIFEIVRRF